MQKYLAIRQRERGGPLFTLQSGKLAEMCPPSHNSSCAQLISTGSATAVTVTELVLPLLQQQLVCQTILSRHWAVGAAVPIKGTYALRQKFFAQQLLRFHGHSKVFVQTNELGEFGRDYQYHPAPASRCVTGFSMPGLNISPRAERKVVQDLALHPSLLPQTSCTC